MQEAKSSSAIENIFTRADELYKAISDTVKEEQANPNTKQVLRCRDALGQVFRISNQRMLLTSMQSLNIYRQIKDSTRAFVRLATPPS